MEPNTSIPRMISEIPSEELADELSRRCDTFVLHATQWDTRKRKWGEIMRAKGPHFQLMGVLHYVTKMVETRAGYEVCNQWATEEMAKEEPEEGQEGAGA